MFAFLLSVHILAATFVPDDPRTDTLPANNAAEAMTNIPMTRSKSGCGRPAAQGLERHRSDGGPEEEPRRRKARQGKQGQEARGEEDGRQEGTREGART